MGKQRADIRERQVNAGCGFSAEVWHQALPQTGSPLPQLPSKGFSHQLHHKKGLSQSEDPLPAPPSCHCRAPTSQLPAQMHPTAPHRPRRAPSGHGVLCRLWSGAGALRSLGQLPKPKPCPASKQGPEEGAELLLPCPQLLGTRSPALPTQQLPGSGELV